METDRGLVESTATEKFLLSILGSSNIMTL